MLENLRRKKNRMPYKGRSNKSLHPIWSPVTAVASCTIAGATALPVAQTGELNRYVWRTEQGDIVS